MSITTHARLWELNQTAYLYVYTTESNFRYFKTMVETTLIFAPQDTGIWWEHLKRISNIKEYFKTGYNHMWCCSFDDLTANEQREYAELIMMRSQLMSFVPIHKELI